VVRDDAGKPVSTATVKLSAITGDRHYTATTSASGEFALAELVAGEYQLVVESEGKTWGPTKPVALKDGAMLTSALQLSSQTPELRILPSVEAISVQGSGGEHLSSGEVSSLPLNARDFSKLLMFCIQTTTRSRFSSTTPSLLTTRIGTAGGRGSRSTIP
jgi:hypothetical protein